jgi:hypothetical protein
LFILFSTFSVLAAPEYVATPVSDVGSENSFSSNKLGSIYSYLALAKITVKGN